MLEIFGALAPILQKLISLLPNPEDRQKAIETLQNFQLEMARAQTQINALEAQNANLFVSGWRPACGWVCVAGLVYSVVQPPFHLPPVDLNMVIGILGGLLGLGTMRTAEKIAGVAK